MGLFFTNGIEKLKFREIFHFSLMNFRDFTCFGYETIHQRNESQLNLNINQLILLPDTAQQMVVVTIVNTYREEYHRYTITYDRTNKYATYIQRA